jgi:hypothetical protein
VSPSGRPGIAAAALAALLLWAQLGTLSHGALERHARCQHGDFIDAGEDELLPPPPTARGAGPSAATTGVPLSGDHRHCLAQADADADLTLRPPAPELLTPHDDRAPAPEQRATAAGRDRYRLVPKQSPPA